MVNWLVLSILLPLAGVGVIWTVADLGRRPIRAVALVTTLAALACALVVMAQFPERDYAASVAWLPLTAAPDGGATGQSSAGVDIQLNVGLDGLSLWLYGLSAVLMVTAVLVSWEAIGDRPASFYSLLLLLETGMLGVFAARDIVLFYVFFEFTLIPLFFLIGIWGSEERRYAAVKFFLFTLAGSVLTFLGLLAIVLWDFNHGPAHAMTFSIPELTARLTAAPIDPHVQAWIFAALFAGFAIKVPLFPLHTWLPLAHVQAPTAGSVLLAGVLLKVGTYGFVRFSLTLLPDASAAHMPLVLGLSTAGIVYGALVALAQSDIKRLIAYSSVSHLGFCMLGLFAFNPLGLAGGTLQMINHGLSTGGLFAIVGMIYERYHSRQIADFGGLARRLPLLSTMMVVFTMSSIGLPGLNGFVGEFLLLLGMFQRAWADAPPALSAALLTMAVLAVSGVVLGAWYMLWLVQRVFFGPLREPHVDHGHGHAVHDLSLREAAALVPLVVLMVWIGVAPKFFLDRLSPVLDPLAVRLEQSVQDHFAAPAADAEVAWTTLPAAVGPRSSASP